MANIQPTIDELDQPTVMLQIRKIAGVVDSNLESVNDELGYIQGQIDQMEDVSGRVTTLENEMDTVKSDLIAVENKNTQQDTTIEQNATAIETEKNARIDNDITDVGLKYNPNTGSLEIQLLREEGNLDDSVIARFIKTATLIPTSTSRAFKIRFEFYDGTNYDTNEFLIPEGGGTDVSVTGVTVVDGTTPDSFQVHIQLSDGEPLKSNDYVIDIPASENTYPTAVTGTVIGTNIDIDITLNNNQHVKGTVDISTLATTQWVNTQLDNYVTNEDFGDLQEQLNGITISSIVSQDSPNVIKVSNAVNGNSADIKLDLSIEGTDIVLSVENTDGTQQGISRISVGDIPFDINNIQILSPETIHLNSVVNIGDSINKNVIPFFTFGLGSSVSNMIGTPYITNFNLPMAIYNINTPNRTFMLAYGDSLYVHGYNENTPLIQTTLSAITDEIDKNKIKKYVNTIINKIIDTSSNYRIVCSLCIDRIRDSTKLPLNLVRDSNATVLVYQNGEITNIDNLNIIMCGGGTGITIGDGDYEVMLTFDRIVKQ